jgi:hypothetical protein
MVEALWHDKVCQLISNQDNPSQVGSIFRQGKISRKGTKITKQQDLCFQRYEGPA